MDVKDYKFLKKPGATSILLNNGRILIMKRLWLPIVSHPGEWYFVSGKEEPNETSEQNAYREIKEETGIAESELKLIAKMDDVMIVNHKKLTKWSNTLFIFCSKTDKIKLNFEHTDYKWATYDEFMSKTRAADSLGDKEGILELIRSNINGC